LATQARVSPELRAWAETSIGRIGNSVARVEKRRERKLLLIHLDGVPRGLLNEAISEGRMPFLARMVRSGHYNLDGAFWGSPASTPCFQAGALYGIRHPNLPAYSWFDRDLQRVIKMNVPADAYAIEQKLHRQVSHSLLEGGGTAYLSLFRAYAQNRLSMSALANMKVMVRALMRDLHGIRTVKRRNLIQCASELIRETWHAGVDVLRWVKKVGDSRHEREFFTNRFFMISLGWHIAQSRALIDMVRGVPAIYLVFGNYDEVAHRRGPRSEQATRELYRADAHFEELYTVAKTLDEPYDVVFVTDHGHVDSAPFEKRGGRRLGDYLLEGAVPPMPSELERALLDGREAPALIPAPLDEVRPEVIEAGNFSHVYLTREKAPLEARELLARYPQVLARAVANRDIGIVAVRRRDHAIAIIQGKPYTADELEGSALSREFSRRAVADLLRELPHMPTAGDIVLYGEAVQKGGTVGFAWEFGSHGGLTNIETESIVCWPSDVPLDLAGMSHCSQLYERLSSYYRN
jgi:hypothetical protein